MRQQALQPSESISFGVEELMATPEELSHLEASDREALEELDSELRHLKDVEKAVLDANPAHSEESETDPSKSLQ